MEEPASRRKSQRCQVVLVIGIHILTLDREWLQGSRFGPWTCFRLQSSSSQQQRSGAWLFVLVYSATRTEGLMSLQRSLLLPACFGSFLLFSSPSQAVEFMVDPVQGSGYVDVDAGALPQIFGTPVGAPLELDFTFIDMKHVELDDSATTNIEFGVGNTGNDVDLDYRIVFDLSDMNGNLITNEAIVVEGTAQAGFIQTENLPLHPLPPVKFHDFHISVETMFADPVSGGLFDFYVAGGGGDPGTIVSGPVRFNRAVVGIWVPEPASWTLLVPLAMVACRRRRK